MKWILVINFLMVIACLISSGIGFWNHDYSQAIWAGIAAFWASSALVGSLNIRRR